MAARLGTFHPAKQDAPGLLLRGGLCYRDEKIRTEHWQKLTNARKKDFHVFSI